MAQQERTMSPPRIGSSSIATGTAKQSLSPLRQRPLGRATTFADVYHPLRQRRSSTFSDSVDSTRQSLKSSTDDLLLPRPKHSDFSTNHEPSHWHSLPLALALFPALGGLFFNNGSAIVTDLTLLALAAIFLNWSVRLPWDWYISAQSLQTEDVQSYPDYHSDTIIEEGSEEEEQQSSQQDPPKSENKNASKEPQGPSSSQLAAAAELRVHELLALSACFIFPAIGAWLLHHIRYQLSRPSEGLVSNYNLTIFLLASELRPLSHLIKMVQTRTLHLQRTVATNPHLPPQSSASSLTDLSTRLAELESHIADTTTTTTTTTTANGNTSNNPPPSQDTLTSQIRKNLQPDLDALNRAVRRYEKKATLLAMQTESRLVDLEKRMTDAITLAAAAERTSQSNRQRNGPGISLLFDYVATVAMLPIRLAWGSVMLPGRVIGGLVGQVEGYMGRKIRRELRTAGRGEGRGSSGSERRRGVVRGGKKVM